MENGVSLRAFKKDHYFRFNMYFAVFDWLPTGKFNLRSCPILAVLRARSQVRENWNFRLF